MSDPGVILPDSPLISTEINHVIKERHSLRFLVAIGRFKTTAQRAGKD